MSIFDKPITDSENFKFFHSFSKSKEFLVQKKPLFECPILFQKRTGSLLKCFIIIVDEKLVLFKVK